MRDYTKYNYYDLQRLVSRDPPLGDSISFTFEGNIINWHFSLEEVTGKKDARMDRNIWYL